MNKKQKVLLSICPKISELTNPEFIKLLIRRIMTSELTNMFGSEKQIHPDISKISVTDIYLSSDKVITIDYSTSLIGPIKTESSLSITTQELTLYESLWGITLDIFRKLIPYSTDSESVAEAENFSTKSDHDNSCGTSSSDSDYEYERPTP